MNERRRRYHRRTSRPLARRRGESGARMLLDEGGEGDDLVPHRREGPSSLRARNIRADDQKRQSHLDGQGA